MAEHLVTDQEVAREKRREFHRRREREAAAVRRRVAENMKGPPIVRQDKIDFLAGELAVAILAGKPDERLVFQKDGSVRLAPGKIVVPPQEWFLASLKKMTKKQRLEELDRLIATLLGPVGWEAHGEGHYRKCFTEPYSNRP